jgi:CheY-like chemotaxis protein
MAVVLIVDDEAMVRLTAADFAASAGHEVIEAADADEAIRILESRTDIEVVFSDVSMPGSMDGLRLLQVIRDRWPPIRLLLTSGKALPNAAQLPSGAVFVPKPYEYSALADALAPAG